MDDCHVIGNSLLVTLMVTGLATQGRAQRHDDHTVDLRVR